MIIKSTRIKTSSGANRLGRHIWEGAENEFIETLAGTREELDLMIADAQRSGATYAIRHVVISPSGSMTDDDWRRAADAYMSEFSAEGHPYSLVRHTKPRASGEGADQHAHLLIAEVNFDTGRILDNSHSFARQEKVARVLEFRFGHVVIPGKFNRVVATQLLDEGHDDVAGAMRSAILTERPTAAYGSEEFQIAKRQGVDLAGLKAALTKAIKSGANPIVVARENGARVYMGGRHWLIDFGGKRPKALHRFCKLKAAIVATAIQHHMQKGFVPTTRLVRRGGVGRGVSPQKPDTSRRPCLSDEDDSRYAHGRGWIDSPTMRI